MPLRSLETRWGATSLALSALWLCGCPQLLSDEFSLPEDTAALDGHSPSVLESGPGMGQAGSSSTPLPAFPVPADEAPDGGTPAEPDAPDGGALAPDPEPDPNPPSVVSVSPSNGASGVAANAVVTLTFSEPMNRGAVEDAYASSDLPAGSLSFDWSANDSVLRITPAEPLVRAAGEDPATTVARRYAFEIGAAALDRQGQALPRFSSSFSTLREITQTLSALEDRSLSGNWRSDDVFGTNDCALAGQVTCIGDSSNGNSTYRGFLSFDLSELPAQVDQLSSAQLRLSVDALLGSPFAGLGALGVEHVSFDSIDLDAFSAAGFGALLQLSTGASEGAQLSVDVLAAVRDDLPARALSQFRLRFGTASDDDGDADLVEVLGSSEQLAIHYLVP